MKNETEAKVSVTITPFTLGKYLKHIADTMQRRDLSIAASRKEPYTEAVRNQYDITHLQFKACSALTIEQMFSGTTTILDVQVDADPLNTEQCSALASVINGFDRMVNRLDSADFRPATEFSLKDSCALETVLNTAKEKVERVILKSALNTAHAARILGYHPNKVNDMRAQIMIEDNENYDFDPE